MGTQRTPKGKAIVLGDEDVIDYMPSPEDIERAVQQWKEYAPDGFDNMLDAMPPVNEILERNA